MGLQKYKSLTFLMAAALILGGGVLNWGGSAFAAPKITEVTTSGNIKMKYGDSLNVTKVKSGDYSQDGFVTFGGVKFSFKGLVDSLNNGNTLGGTFSSREVRDTGAAKTAFKTDSIWIDSFRVHWVNGSSTVNNKIGSANKSLYRARIAAKVSYGRTGGESSWSLWTGDSLASDLPVETEAAPITENNWKTFLDSAFIREAFKDTVPESGTNIVLSANQKASSSWLRARFSDPKTLDATLSFENPNYKSTTVPKDTGTYAVILSVKKSGNFDVSNNVVVDSLKIRRWNLADGDVISLDENLKYDPSGLYTIRTPLVTSVSRFGAITKIYADSVGGHLGGDVNVSSGNAGAPSDSVSVAVVAGNKVTVKFSKSANDTGKVAVFLRAEGKLDKKSTTSGLNDQLWSSKTFVCSLSIVPKRLTDASVSMKAIDGVKIIYSGDSIHDPKLFNVVDGETFLQRGKDFEIDSSVARTSGAFNRGTGWWGIRGTGRYDSSVTLRASYPILPCTLQVVATSVVNKQYDGTVNFGNTIPDSIQAGDTHLMWPKGGFIPKFIGLVKSEAFNDSDFTFENAKLSDAAVGDGKTATATVSLKVNGPRAKNYVLPVGAITYAPVSIVKREPTDSADTTTFDYFITDTHYFLGTAARRGVTTSPGKPLKFKGSITNGTAKLDLVYRYGIDGYDTADFKDKTDPTKAYEGDTTLAPRLAGKYGVYARVGPGGPNVKDSTYYLGDYTIKQPEDPVIDVDLPTDTTVRQTRTLVLSVQASSPNAGTIKYQWWQMRNGEPTDTVKMSSTSASFTVPTSAKANHSYYVILTNTKPGTQADASIKSKVVNVQIDDPPVDISGKGKVAVTPATWPYTGIEITPSGANVSVQAPTIEEGAATGELKDLVEGVDYRLSYTSNRNVGKALATITYLDAYRGTDTVSFQIVKRTPDDEDFNFVEFVPYTGAAVGAKVKLKDHLSGAGAIVTYYDGDTAVPTTRGYYGLTVTVGSGSNFNASLTPIAIGAFEIGMGELDTSCFKYTIPVGHKEGVTKDFGIGAVTFAKGTGYGTFKVTYNGSDSIPTVGGTYTVEAVITGGENYDKGSVVLGSYVIVGSGDAVATVGREVPKAGGKEVVAVAPVKVTASSFSAGPSPVSKNGTVKFFSTKAVKSGSLYVFDAAGNAVAKVSASGIGEVASWNLKDSKGAAVAEGTYVVKGVLTGKDGTREKVSFLFSVAK